MTDVPLPVDRVHVTRGPGHSVSTVLLDALELLGLVACVPLAILLIGIPIALAIKFLLMLVGVR